MTGQLFGVAWSTWGVVALSVALVYSVLWPRPRSSVHAGRRSAWAHLVLRWAHAAVWVLLAAYCFTRAGWLPLAGPVATGLAWSALAMYALFVLTLWRDRRRPA